MRKLWAWCHSHPLVSLFLLLIMGSIAAHLLANARSERRWQKYGEAARARGVKLQFAELEPPAVADAENFAAIPLIQATFAGTALRPFDLPPPKNRGEIFGNALKHRPIDWAEVQGYFQEIGWLAEKTSEPARDALQALGRLDPALEQWREGLRRPHTRFPFDYARDFSTPLPHLNVFQDVSRLLALRLGARLAFGDSPGAYAEWQTGLKSAEHLRDQPFLINGLVHQAMLTNLLRAVGLGLQQRQWQEPELQRLEADLASIGLWKTREFAFAGERAAFNSFTDRLLAASNFTRASLFTGAVIQDWWFPLLPNRIFRDNQLRQNQFINELLAQADPERGTYNLDASTPSDPDNVEGWAETHYFYLNRFSAPIYLNLNERWVHLQTTIDHARIACALERFRLAKGSYPQQLAELVPVWIEAVPLDLYGLTPIIYRLLENGTYELRSVGNNREDDGGTLDPKRGETKQKDEVWLYAPDATP